MKVKPALLAGLFQKENLFAQKDGNRCDNTWLTSFGSDGLENIYQSFKDVKNGLVLVACPQTDKLGLMSTVNIHTHRVQVLSLHE